MIFRIAVLRGRADGRYSRRRCTRRCRSSWRIRQAVIFHLIYGDIQDARAGVVSGIGLGCRILQVNQPHQRQVQRRHGRAVYSQHRLRIQVLVGFAGSGDVELSGLVQRHGKGRAVREVDDSGAGPDLCLIYQIAVFVGFLLTGLLIHHRRLHDPLQGDAVRIVAGRLTIYGNTGYAAFVPVQFRRGIGVIDGRGHFRGAFRAGQGQYLIGRLDGSPSVCCRLRILWRFILVGHFAQPVGLGHLRAVLDHCFGSVCCLCKVLVTVRAGLQLGRRFAVQSRGVGLALGFDGQRRAVLKLDRGALSVTKLDLGVGPSVIDGADHVAACFRIGFIQLVLLAVDGDLGFCISVQGVKVYDDAVFSVLSDSAVNADILVVPAHLVRCQDIYCVKVVLGAIELVAARGGDFLDVIFTLRQLDGRRGMAVFNCHLADQGIRRNGLLIHLLFRGGSSFDLFGGVDAEDRAGACFVFFALVSRFKQLFQVDLYGDRIVFVAGGIPDQRRILVLIFQDKFMPFACVDLAIGGRNLSYPVFAQRQRA